MIILHAGFNEGKLILWGETAQESAFAPPKKRGRKPKIPRPEHFIYDAGLTALVNILNEAGLESASDNMEPITATAWIPSTNTQPVASSPMIAEPSSSNKELTLLPWEISAVELSISGAIDFLSSCVNKKMLETGVIIGNDLAYWVKAMRYAGSLVARQQFLPDLTKQGDTYSARWMPIFLGEDQDRIQNLAKSMPETCRALTTHQIIEAPNIPARETLFDFIQLIVDHIIRHSAPPAEARKVTKKSRKKEIAFPSVHDQWLHALSSPDGFMEGDPAELYQFAYQIKEWQRPIQLISSAPFRLCFRLEEPTAPSSEKEDDRKIDARQSYWNVKYLLLAKDDPSLLIPAKDVYNKRKHSVQNILKRYNFNAQEYLLFALGQASVLCPMIETSLRTSVPDGYTTDQLGAYKFLTEMAGVLQNAGFPVMLPAWWTGMGRKKQIVARASVQSPKMQASSGLTLDTIVSFNWELALGNEKLTLGELRQLAKLKAPLVKFRGEWVLINQNDIQSAIVSWKRKADELPLRDLVRMSIGAAETPHGFALGEVNATGWVNEFLSDLQTSSISKSLTTPGGFHGQLRPYQSRGFTWLEFLQRYGLGACLADDMGLGKTIETLALLQHNRDEGVKKPVLLICPTSVLSNWRKEAERFTPELSVLVHHGVVRTKKAAFKKQAEKHAIVVSSYALLHRDLDSLKKVDWSGLILDEAQNIKNHETKQSKAARSLKADYRIALTGTPVENNVGDLWSIMEFLNPGFLGTQKGFKQDYFIPIQTGRDTDAATKLKSITAPFILRRLKTDKSIITDLPDKVEMKVYCQLTKEQASLYEAIAEEALESLKETEGIQRKGLVLATLMKMKQVCNHPAQFLKDNSSVSGRSGKLSRLKEMLDEIHANNDHALIFTQFTQMGEILKKYLQEMFGQEVLFLHGGVTKKKRDKMIEDFQSDRSGNNIFILSLKAGGTGLNLTRANHVFHFDRWWNPAVEDQATDRAFRIGQTQNVMVHKFLCEGTLEERIDEMIERKKEIASEVVGTGEGWLTELSNEELKDMFTLRKEAVGD